MRLQEEIQSSELLKQQGVVYHVEGAMLAAQNLGQIAAFFLQRGAMAEAGVFYMQVNEWP